MFPFTIKETISMMVSLQRITRFLNAHELDPDEISTGECIGGASVEIKDGTFTWDGPKQPQLHGVNITAKKGSLVAIVGAVGSGKSSILQGIRYISEAFAPLLEAFT